MGVFRAKELLDEIEICSLRWGSCTSSCCTPAPALTINENWDPDVRDDMEMMLNRHEQYNVTSVTNDMTRLVPESIPWKHSCEGPDDMPAHAKACLLGSNLTLPICEGRVTLGTWQGVWLCEHRSDKDYEN